MLLSSHSTRSKIHSRRVLGVLLCTLLAACQPRVTLMPTPVAYQSGEIYPFTDAAKEEKSTRLNLFYATNRPAEGPVNNRDYDKGITDRLRLGESTMRIGDGSFSWEELEAISTGSERRRDPLISLEQSKEIGVLEPHDDIKQPPASAKAFADAINRALAENQDKYLFVYLNGANSNFYRSVALATQFQHFNGRGAVTLAFAWPSTGNLLTYAKDVELAAETAPLFGRLLEFLAANTDAEYIYILAYSAGAQVASRGLYALRKAHADEEIEQLRKRLRINEVYFAAPDEDTYTFGTVHLPAYIDMVDNVTVSLMFNDAVLWMAEWHHGANRLGRPDDDNSEFNEQEAVWIDQAIVEGKLDIIDMQYEPRPRNVIFTHHGNWYKNTWVMSDILFQFYFDAPPEERGLAMENQRFGVPVWYFPADYPKRVHEEAVRRIEQHRLPETDIVNEARPGRPDSAGD